MPAPDCSLHPFTCTDPAWRRRGVARALLQQALAALHGAGIDTCHLMVFADNPGGAAFWRAAGALRRSELDLYSIATHR